MAFLDKFSMMMFDEVSRHWPRFKEYFDVWCYLVRENKIVQTYCQQKRMVENILDFVMEDDSIIPRKGKRHQMGSQYYPPDFEYPL